MIKKYSFHFKRGKVEGDEVPICIVIIIGFNEMNKIN